MTESVEYVDIYGEHRWCFAGTSVSHREDGPAIIRPNVYQAWCRYGQYHRTDGPAIMYENGKRFWWVDGKVIESNEEFQEKAKISDLDMTIMVLKYGDVR